MNKFKKNWDTTNLIVSAIFLLFVVVVLFLLVRQVRVYQAQQASKSYLGSLQVKFEDILGKDLFSGSLFRGSCWQETVSVEGQGSKLRIRSSNADYATVLVDEALPKHSWLTLKEHKLFRPGMVVRICHENQYEILAIRANPSQNGGDDLRVPISSETSGGNYLAYGYPKGSVVALYEEVVYEKAPQTVTRTTRDGRRLQIPDVESFSVEAIAGERDSFLITYVLKDSLSETTLLGQLSWTPWSVGPALTTRQIQGALSKN